MGIQILSAQSVRISSTGNNYYNEHTFAGDASAAIYTQKSFGFGAERLEIVNDSDNKDVDVSFDGATLDGTVKCAETKIFHPSGKTSVYIKTESGSSDKVRLWVE